MSAPPTQIVMLDFPPAELPEFMAALCSALPGSAWFCEMIHNDGCPLHGGETMAVCTCAVARVVVVQRLQPTDTSGDGAGSRPSA